MHVVLIETGQQKLIPEKVESMISPDQYQVDEHDVLTMPEDVFNWWADLARTMEEADELQAYLLENYDVRKEIEKIISFSADSDLDVSAELRLTLLKRLDRICETNRNHDFEEIFNKQPAKQGIYEGSVIHLTADSCVQETDVGLVEHQIWRLGRTPDVGDQLRIEYDAAGKATVTRQEACRQLDKSQGLGR